MIHTRLKGRSGREEKGRKKNGRGVRKDKDGERDSLERGENLLAETHPDLEVETGLVMLHVLLQRARSHQFSNVDNTIIFYPEIKSCCDIAVLKSG